MTKFVNLTPHALNIISSNGDVLHLAKPDVDARCTTSEKVINNINGIDIVDTTFGEITNLPEPKEDTIYIVSRIVKNACEERLDVVVPGKPIRDTEGNIIGAKGLSL